ncbi:GspE family protein [Rhodoferax sp. TH121]|uniref:GspE/PulE family protein n=1 Tax=Rhodoferax sp. TH121 TaxID=2022803 RepID=UPI000B95EFFC|nr:GspE/PulE family protein [Rhodoferax sp. TH121]OYQ43396.1 GspE family protein [Rhodoferax sp. TH121]
MTSTRPLPALSVLSSQVLDAALKDLRQHPICTSGQLWLGLLERLQTDEATLKTALLSLHGVATYDDLELAQLSPAARLLDEADQGLAAWTFVLNHTEHLLTEDPWSAAVSKRLLHGTPIQITLARPGQWEQLQHKHGASSQGIEKTPERGPESGVLALNDVVQFVEHAIVSAYQDGASDIHFETDRNGIAVKFRLDGVMAAGPRLPDAAKAEEVISRIKVLAQLDITERRRPQDGRIHWSHAELGTVDLRVSIMPSIFGEDAVLRLLDKAQLRQSQQSISLKTLGFEDTVAATLRGLAQRPHGMLLVTGPTGSGKTTTVYAALSEVNDGLEKIITIEDPVEYELPGVLQIPVNEQKGLTFATGLRSILRHDPDKILVGEIRDAETAQIAVQSSLTGHLVFTTVHANSLFDVLGRFHHFGIETFAMASALNGIVVQRLLRRTCPHCMEWRAPTAAEVTKLQGLDMDVPHRIPVAKRCNQCRHTGYRGRFVVAEVHELNDNIRDLMVRKTSLSELKEALYQHKDQVLRNQALLQVTRGNTTLEELIRVIGLV